MSKLTLEEVQEKVFSLLEDVCEDDAPRQFPDRDLFDDLGLLDSMGAVELLVGIEDEFGVSIAPTEVPRTSMNTARRIAQRIEERL